MKNWYRLKLNVDNAVKDTFVFPEVDDLFKMFHYSADEVFTSEWISYMAEHNLKVNKARIFLRHNSQKDMEAHIDINATNRPNPVNLNWVHGTDDRDMVWYQTEGVDLDLIFSDFGSRHFQASISRLTEIDRCRIGNQITLVNTGILHATSPSDYPNKKNYRYLISAGLELSFKITWDQFVEQHQHLLITI